MLKLVFGMMGVAALIAQTPNPQELLNLARTRVLSNIQHLPRYSCEQTIQRFWYEDRVPVGGCRAESPDPGTLTLARSDGLRLDVAVGSGQEMFSWHGEDTFRTGDIDELVRSGPISSGTFFSFLSNIFGEGLETVRYRGSGSFTYALSSELSTFQIRAGSKKLIIGYGGSFEIDESSSKLRVLKIHANRLPNNTLVCDLDMQVQYSTARVGDAELELPSTVSMVINDLNNGQTCSVKEYRNCHQFVGESVIRFDGSSPRPEAVKGSRSNVPIAVPAGRDVKIRISSSIRPDRAWGGDRIEGFLESDITGDQDTILMPKGAPVFGHLLRVERVERQIPSYNISLQFDTILTGGMRFPLILESKMEPARSGLEPRLYQIQSVDTNLGSRFHIGQKTADLRGTMTYWITTPPRP